MNQIIQGHVLNILPTLPDESVHCCVTSPPYWGLRDYGTAKWEGGNPECDHKGPALCSSSSSLAGYTSENIKLRNFSVPMKDTCSKCGAIRIDNQLGLEGTPDEYVEKLVAVFTEVKRVLRDDGTLWLNLGDSYASNTKGSGGPSSKQDSNAGSRYNPRKFNHVVKEKDLMGIPWMVAFALRADGWYLRQDIIWHKPNPMPESVKDRCTKSHEYIFLLSKSQKYYFDNQAILEESIRANEAIYDNGKNGHGGGISHAGQGSSTRKFRKDSQPEDLARAFNRRREANPELRQDKMKIPSNWDTDPGHHESFHRNGRSLAYSFKRETKEAEIPGQSSKSHRTEREDVYYNVKRNKRSVWTVATEPFREAHFATFPQKLIEPCIKAGCPRGGVVLDPFMGSGTTAVVSRKLDRNYLGIELNPQYIEIATRRIEKEIGLLFKAAQ